MISLGQREIPVIISGEAGRTMINSNILQKHLSAIWNMDSCLARPIPAQCAVVLCSWLPVVVWLPSHHWVYLSVNIYYFSVVWQRTRCSYSDWQTVFDWKRLDWPVWCIATISFRIYLLSTNHKSFNTWYSGFRQTNTHLCWPPHLIIILDNSANQTYLPVFILRVCRTETDRQLLNSGYSNIILLASSSFDKLAALK